MSKGVVFGVAVIFAVVAVAALVAVLVSGKKEDDNDNFPPVETRTPPEVFMQTNNSCKCLRTFQFHFLLTFVLFSPWRGDDQG